MLTALRRKLLHSAIQTCTETACAFSREAADANGTDKRIEALGRAAKWHARARRAMELLQGVA